MSLKLLLQKFLDRVEKVLSSEDDPLGSEFLALRDLSRQLTQNEEYAALVGALEENNRKNRYKDIRPFDCTRVSLLPIEGVPGSDYINANFIQGPTGRTSYIASQGPLPHTVDDFWAMLWQYEVEVVVMACNEREAGKAKCERYWPYNDEEKWFRNINIKLVREDLICEDFVVRHLLASDGTTERPIQQFHYVNWPDHGAPETCTSLLDMIAMIRVAQPGDSHPIVVHCSAGCGRTGTICAVDYAWNVLKNGTLTEEFNVFNIIVEMRKQRLSCVQTKDQYILVHQAIAELFEQHLSMIKDHLYENVVVEGAGREVIEDIYEDVRGMNLGDKKEDVNEDIYVNADSLPKKRLSSHAAEKIIMETIANMVTDEDDETPDKFYAVSSSLSKMNAGIQPGTKTVTEDKGRNWGQGPPALPAKKTSPAPDQDGRKSDPTSNATQEKQGPPALPVKKTNLLPEQDGRKSDPTTKQEKLPVQRKFSLGSLKRKQKSVIGDSSRSPDLPPKKGSAEKGRSQSTLEKDESGKTEKNLLNFGEQMMKGKAKKGKNGADVSYQSDDVEDHVHVANVNELRQKLEHTGIPVAGVMAHPVAKKRASSIDKVCVEKTMDKSQKSSLPHEKTAVKPEAAAKSNRIKGWKKTNSGEKTGKIDAPKALPRHRVGSDASQGSPNEERKKVPLPLPKPRELVSNADKTEFQRQMSESSDYSQPYEMVKSVGAQLSHSTLHQSESTGTSTYKLEESVAANDSSYSYVDVAGTAGQNRETPSLPSEKPADFQCIAHKDQSTQGSVIRRTKLLPDWLDDENPYETLGGKTEVPSSVGADETTDKQDNPDLDSLYSDQSSSVVSYKSSSSSQPANGATSWSSRDSLDDERPPVPVKLYDVTPVTETGKVNESTVKDSHGGKFKFSFSNLKNKFQVGSSKSADISSLDNMKGDEPRHPPIPFILAFPNRTDKPKGGRPPPWAK